MLDVWRKHFVLEENMLEVRVFFLLPFCSFVAASLCGLYPC